MFNSGPKFVVDKKLITSKNVNVISISFHGSAGSELSMSLEPYTSV